jgi:hypothetical protein
MTTIAAASSMFSAYCSPPADKPEPCDVWLTQQQVIDGAVIAAPRDCTYNISWTSVERCEMWGGTWTPIGCQNIDPELAVSVWVGGP